MIRLLIYASLAYTAILVLALALVLISILGLLIHVSRTLARVRAHLGDVARDTQPLAGQLGALTTAAVTSADAVSRSVERLASARRGRPAAARERIR